MKQTSQRTKQKYNDACISYAVQGRAKTKGKLWVFAAILTLCGLVVSTSCSSKDDPVEPGRQEYTGVPLVILDTDLGSSTDDLFALEMLHRYEQEGRCRLLGVVVDRMGESIFTPSATGRCRYQLPGSADWNAAMLEKIRRYNKMM